MCSLMIDLAINIKAKNQSNHLADVCYCAFLAMMNESSARQNTQQSAELASRFGMQVVVCMELGTMHLRTQVIRIVVRCIENTKGLCDLGTNADTN